MATYGSDDEQVEALKAWWKDNGSSLLTGVILVLAVFFGVRQWQSMQAAESAAASDLYQQLADLAVANLTSTVDEESLAAAESVYARLKAEHEASIYARYGALAIARFRVDQEQLAQAAAELQWVLDNPDGGFLREVDEELLLAARLRLARVRLAQDDAQAALSLLREANPGSFTSSYAEAEGDALFQLGQRDEARSAYQRALATNQSTNQVLLQLKLQDLGVSPTEVQ